MIENRNNDNFPLFFPFCAVHNNFMIANNTSFPRCAGINVSYWENLHKQLSNAKKKEYYNISMRSIANWSMKSQINRRRLLRVSCVVIVTNIYHNVPLFIWHRILIVQTNLLPFFFYEGCLLVLYLDSFKLCCHSLFQHAFTARGCVFLV